MTPRAARGSAGWPWWGVKMLVILGVCLVANLLLLLGLVRTWAVGANARSCTVIRYSFPTPRPASLSAAGTPGPDMVLQARAQDWPL